MNRIIVIAQNTFRESVRDKVLFNLLIFAILMVGASIIIAELSLNLEKLIITRMGLSIMLFFGLLISIFIGTGLVYKEIDKRTIYAMLAKPIHRAEFILGKFFGISTTLFVNCLTMVIGLNLALLYIDYTSKEAIRFHWEIFPAAFLIFLELIIIISLALLFSSFSSPILSIMFSIVLYLIGSLSQDLYMFAKTSPSAVLKYLAYFIYYIIPNLANFNYITTVAHDNPIPMNNFFMTTVYGVIYISILLVLTTTIFQKRNFK